MKLTQRVLHVLEYILLRVGLATVLSLGFARAMRVARGGADLAFRLDRRHRERALNNLRNAMPELSEAERLRIARDSIRSFGYAYIELMYEQRIVQKRSVRRHFTIGAHPKTLEVLERETGVVFVTAHIGNWELSGSMVPHYGIPLVSVARPIENPLISRYLFTLRERTGQKIVAKRGAVRDLTRALREGKCLGVISDQNAGRHGIFTEFFGRPASTVGTPAALALKFDVPMVPGYQRRLDENFRHHLQLDEPIEPPCTGDRALDVWLMTQEMNARFEKWIRQYPDQWLWAHRRWKTQPKEGEEWRPSPSTSAV